MTTDLEVLAEIAGATLTGRPLVHADTLRAQLADEPWIIDDLTRAKEIGFVLGPNLVPTIAGLQRLSTADTSEALDSLQRLFKLLRDSYASDAGNTARTAAWSAHALKIKEDVAARLLAILWVSATAAFMSGGGHEKGGFSTVSLGPAILGIDPFEKAPAEEPVVTFADVTISARDFRGIDLVDWTPGGVCLLAGPNGAGKSTVLEVLTFLHLAYSFGIPAAVAFARGPKGLRRIGASGPPEVVFGVQVGSLKWTLRINVVSGGAVGDFPGEQLTRDGKVLLRRAAFAQEWYLGRERLSSNSEGRTCLRVAADSGRIEGIEPLLNVVQDYVAYANYRLDLLREGGAGTAGDSKLATDGHNLFQVLLTWKTAPRRFRDQFEWVERHLKQALPGALAHIEFGTPLARAVPAVYFLPGSKEELPIASAADGLLCGLLHLTAVAGAAEGSVVAIDEVENHLHPFAIRTILSCMRELAEERHLIILLTSHSPVVMNAFRDEPERVFVMERSEPGRPLPTPITELHSEEWLAQAKLGTLYDQLAFGAPKAPASK